VDPQERPLPLASSLQNLASDDATTCRMFVRDSTGVATVGGLSIVQALADAACTTPAYVYDLDGVARAARDLREAFGSAPSLVAYATKANSAGPVLRAIFGEGCGADVVSGGELELVLASGLDPRKVVFSGVAKRDDEIDQAVGSGPAGIFALQAESIEELHRISARARALGRRARVSLRINPSIQIETHAHVATGHDSAKFGIARADVGEAFAAVDALPELQLVGVSSHIGSTQTSTGPYLAAAGVLFEIARAREAEGAPLSFVDAGGGFGIDYGDGCPVAPPDFVRALLGAQRDARLGDLTIVVEPGRSLVGPFGTLVAAVIQSKTAHASGRRWLMIDAGMNDLIRPALYQARHRIEPVRIDRTSPTAEYRVVGPICESADDFGSFELPHELTPPLVVIRDAGAYGYTMASQYNGRALPAEVFVARGRVAGVLQPEPRSAWVRDRLRVPTEPRA
jgi:diaminopimelate decarboxylase